MNNLKFYAALTLVFTLAACGMSHYLERSATLAKVSRSSVTVLTTSGLGSATVVALYPKYALVLTCAHVLDPTDVTTYVKTTFDGHETTYAASIELVDEDADLALLSVPNLQDVAPLPLAKTEPNLFETVYLYGSPLGQAGTASEGIITSKKELIRQKRFNWRINDGYIMPGISGGTVVNTNGEFVCVPETVTLYRGAIPTPQAGSCIPLADIKTFLAAYKL